MKADDAIGVFDSGLGGLTVARAIRARCPEERLVYLGDTARVPYGTRSAHTVIRYARTCATHLASHGVKLLVVACNTVSAVALPMLRVELDVPVLGVIGPGARAGALASRAHMVGILATEGTVASGAYPAAVAAETTRCEVTQKAAPLLVPLVEEGWLEGDVPRLTVRRYLEPLIDKGVDTIVLGCTHYPLLAPLIEEEAAALAGRPIRIVDSAAATAEELAQLLEQRGLRREGEGSLTLRVTDLPGRFAEVASRFLGEPLTLEDVEAIDL
ncbi:MAG: glutamate racemase [Sandaracinaceae bacterium]